ncbi:CD276 antigen-like isoform X2 [Mobula hypostoma]|uniref:CD276 antigen-like isoform X2 n=1 Tax=Mobula hypostoma TaxID=723540 RepID=UPI002FC36C19
MQDLLKFGGRVGERRKFLNFRGSFTLIRSTFSARRTQRFCPPRWRRMPVLILTMCLTIVTAAESALQQVTGTFGREVTLPCQGTATYRRVYWQKSEPPSTREKVVNARCLPSEPCLELVDPAYANRSEILANSTTGNFSLLLRDLVVADEGVYKCILQSNGVISQRMVNLSIEAEYSQPEVRQLPLDDVRTGNTVNLICTSSSGYPLATLHWVKESTGEALGKGHNLTSYSQDHWRMYQLYSELQLPVDHGPISCLLRTRRGKVLPSAQFTASERLNSLGQTDAIHGVSGGQPGFGQLSRTVVIIISILAWISP